MPKALARPTPPAAGLDVTDGTLGSFAPVDRTTIQSACASLPARPEG